MINGWTKRVDSRKKSSKKTAPNDGYDLAIRKVGERVVQAAKSDTPILIQGKSSITNELVARSVHMNSARCKNNFVLVHCASTSSEFLDFEIF